jgi:hypothetical protein
MVALRLPGGGETGPFVPDMFAARETHDDLQIEEWLVNDLADDLQVNSRALARKASAFNTALALLMFTVIVELAWRL